MSDIKQRVRDFILAEFLPGESPEELEDGTPLISGGILDSLATIKLVAFLEETFSIEVAAHEADQDNLDSVADIVALVESKKG